MEPSWDEMGEEGEGGATCSLFMWIFCAHDSNLPTIIFCECSRYFGPLLKWLVDWGGFSCEVSTMGVLV